MLARSITPRFTVIQLSLFVTSVILFMALGAYVHSGSHAVIQYQLHKPSADLVTAVPIAMVSKPIAAPAAPLPDLDLHVLAPREAQLYSAIYAAQAAGNWTAADSAMAQLNDKRLLGHVLADRYQRRPPTLAELQSWLAAYHELPEADPFYQEARRLPGGKEAALALPAPITSWNGGDRYSAAFGFGGGVAHPPNPAARKLAERVEQALARNELYIPKALIEAEQKRRYIPPEELSALENRVAAGFMHAGKDDIARAWAAEATRADPPAMWTYGLTAWRQGDTAASSTAFAALAQRADVTGPNRAAAAFWAYRAYHKAGNAAQASFWLKQAAMQPRSFYGFLATSLLGTAGSESWQAPSLDAVSIAALSTQPAGWRALALLQMGNAAMAQAELRRLNPEDNRPLESAMLAVADAAQMPGLALQLGGLAVNGAGKPYDAAFYPVPPWQPTDGFQIDRALLYALMRHESGFNPAAVSDKGACGLMQLMPATAQLMSDQKIETGCSGRLREPAFNLGLGQDYVQRLAADPAIGNNLVVLLAAYNGGPARVSQWMTEDARHDPLLFIEGLPVRETRDYIQQVLVHYWMYRGRLGLPLNSLTQLARGEWPHYALTNEQPKLHQAATNASGVYIASTN